MWSGSDLLHLMTCACVRVCAYVWVMIPWYIFVFLCEKATVGAVTFFVKWLSAVQSHIHTNVFPFFPLCRSHWDTRDRSGGDDCFMHQSARVEQGGRSQRQGQTSTCFTKKTPTKQALTALNHQERGSSSQVHALTFECWKTSVHSCRAGHSPCETEERGSAVLYVHVYSWWRCVGGFSGTQKNFWFDVTKAPETLIKMKV